MKVMTIPRYKSRAKVAKALAHASRLCILDNLQDGEKCVGDLVSRVGAEAPTVSRHLSVLLNAGLVSQEKRGQFVFYRASCACISSFFRCMDTVVQAQAKSMNLDVH